jgi:hypothetical protein
MRDDQASVGLDDVGFLHLLAVLIDEIMRKAEPTGDLVSLVRGWL